jgi:hypothetical protein
LERRVAALRASKKEVGSGLVRIRNILACGILMGTASHAATYYVTVAGLGGEKDYEQRFQAQAKEVEKLVSGSGETVTLSGPGATKVGLEKALGDVAARATADDVFVLMLIGHGSFDNVEYKFNVPGADPTAADLAAWCDKIRASRQLVVNMTSSSGGSLAALQRPKRVIITATKSGTEKNATVFARYWVEALRDPAADTDKNEVVTALEAFRYAERKTAAFYETQKRLATEHAVIEDTGKGEGVRAPSPENGQGLLATALPLLRIGAAQRAAADPAKRQLFDKKEQIEQQIDKLKYEKAAMPLDQYRKQLSALLLELARVQEELDK